MARRRRNASPPTRRLLINAREHEESRIAITEGGRLEEYYIERDSLGSTLGNIYKARITNVEKNIGAAFIDFGHQRQGFLHVSDLSKSAVGAEFAALLESVQEARETETVAEVENGDGSEVAEPLAEDDAKDEDDDGGGDVDDAVLTEDGDGDLGEPGWDAPQDALTEDDAEVEEGAAGEVDVEDEPNEDDEVPAGTPAEASAAATAAPARTARRRGGRRRRGRRGGRPGGRDAKSLPPIEEILKKGQEIVVQVIKDGIGTKGPTLTTFLSLPGRFVVLMPGVRKRGVSRRVSDPQQRDRLKDVVRDLRAPDEIGFVVRTAGSDASVEDLQRDLDYLLRLWEQMKTRIREHSAPVLLYQENDLVIRTLRDLYDGQGEIVIDDPATVAKAREFVGELMPDRAHMVTEYTEPRPLFNHYGLEKEIAGLLENRIELESGASLIMEQTEALVAIDVNSGRFKPGAGNIEKNAFQVNLDAATEIARQIRLRDLGGVVVIDFIDMREEKHRKKIEAAFKDALQRDRARIKVARFSPFGIIELTRQRVRPSLKRSVHDECPYCVGTGFIPSDETSCLTVVRKIRDNLWRPGTALVVTVRPEVAEAVLNQQREALHLMEKESGKGIFVRADHRLSYEDVEVRPMVAIPDDMDHRRA